MAKPPPTGQTRPKYEMIPGEAFQKETARLLDTWMRGLEASKVVMGDTRAVSSELTAWITLMGAAVGGDEWSGAELYKLVALHARGLGAEGKPASAALMQLLLLEDALEQVVPNDKSWKPITREMTRVVADAHALGQSQRMGNRHRRQIRDFSPVLRFGSHTVIGFLLGPMESELVDALCGRLLRERTRFGADTAVLDVFGADRDDELLHRTIDGMLRSEAGYQLTLVLTGLHDPDETKEALTKLGCDMSRIRFETDITTYFAGLEP